MKALTVEGDQSVEIAQPGGRITVAVPQDVGGGATGGTCHSFANATTNNFPGTDEDTNYHATTGSAFEALLQGEGWTFNATGCVWTYEGTETRTVRITVCCTPDTDVSSAWGTYLAVAINGDLIGTDVWTVFDHGAGVVFVDYTGSTAPVTADFCFTVSPGDTVQPVIGTRDFFGNHGGLIRAMRMQMTIVTA